MPVPRNKHDRVELLDAAVVEFLRENPKTSKRWLQARMCIGYGRYTRLKGVAAALVSGTAEPTVALVSDTAEPPVALVSDPAESPAALVSDTAESPVARLKGVAAALVSGTAEQTVALVSDTAEPPVALVSDPVESPAALVSDTAESPVADGVPLSDDQVIEFMRANTLMKAIDVERKLCITKYRRKKLKRVMELASGTPNDPLKCAGQGVVPVAPKRSKINKRTAETPVADCHAEATLVSDTAESPVADRRVPLSDDQVIDFMRLNPNMEATAVQHELSIHKIRYRKLRNGMKIASGTPHDSRKCSGEGAAPVVPKRSKSKRKRARVSVSAFFALECEGSSDDEDVDDTNVDDEGCVSDLLADESDDVDEGTYARGDRSQYALADADVSRWLVPVGLDKGAEGDLPDTTADGDLSCSTASEADEGDLSGPASGDEPTYATPAQQKRIRRTKARSKVHDKKRGAERDHKRRRDGKKRKRGTLASRGSAETRADANRAAAMAASTAKARSGLTPDIKKKFADFANTHKEKTPTARQLHLTGSAAGEMELGGKSRSKPGAPHKCGVHHWDFGTKNKDSDIVNPQLPRTATLNAFAELVSEVPSVMCWGCATMMFKTPLRTSSNVYIEVGADEVSPAAIAYPDYSDAIEERAVKRPAPSPARAQNKTKKPTVCEACRVGHQDRWGRYAFVDEGENLVSFKEADPDNDEASPVKEVRVCQPCKALHQRSGGQLSRCNLGHSSSGVGKPITVPDGLQGLKLSYYHQGLLSRVRIQWLRPPIDKKTSWWCFPKLHGTVKKTANDFSGVLGLVFSTDPKKQVTEDEKASLKTALFFLMRNNPLYSDLTGDSFGLIRDLVGEDGVLPEISDVRLELAPCPENSQQKSYTQASDGLLMPVDDLDSTTHSVNLDNVPVGVSLSLHAAGSRSAGDVSGDRGGDTGDGGIDSDDELAGGAPSQRANTHVTFGDRKLEAKIFPFKYAYGEGCVHPNDYKDHPMHTMSPSHYIKARICAPDDKWRKDRDWMFFFFDWMEKRHIHEAQRVMCCPGDPTISGKPLTAEAAAKGGSADSDLKRLFVPSSICGSKGHMKKHFHDLNTACSEYGSPDLFVTFTMPDGEWEDMKKVTGSSDIVDYSVPVVRQFVRRFRQAMKHVRKGSVFGGVTFIFEKLEYQHRRGAPHYHVLLWLEDKENICQHVNATIPRAGHSSKSCGKASNSVTEDRSDDFTSRLDELRKIVLQFQIHKCDVRCQVHRTCVDVHRDMENVYAQLQRLVAGLQSGELSKADQLVARSREDVLLHKFSVLEQELSDLGLCVPDPDANTSEPDLGLPAGIRCRQGYPHMVSDSCYVDPSTDKWVYFRNAPCDKYNDCHVIPYNPKLALLWKGTHNVLCVSQGFMLEYLLKYCAKCEPIFQGVVGDNLAESTKQYFKSDEGRHIYGRLVCMPEVAARFLSIPHAWQSKGVSYLPTDVPSMRMRTIDMAKVKRIAAEQERRSNGPLVSADADTDRHASMSVGDARPERVQKRVQEIVKTVRRQSAITGHFKPATGDGAAVKARKTLGDVLLDIAHQPSSHPCLSSVVGKIELKDHDTSFSTLGIGDSPLAPFAVFFLGGITVVVELDPCLVIPAEVESKIASVQKMCREAGYHFLRLGSDVDPSDYADLVLRFLSNVLRADADPHRIPGACSVYVCGAARMHVRGEGRVVDGGDDGEDDGAGDGDLSNRLDPDADDDPITYRDSSMLDYVKHGVLDDDLNFFFDGKVEVYCARPSSLEHLTYPQYFREYQILQKNQKSKAVVMKDRKDRRVVKRKAARMCRWHTKFPSTDGEAFHYQQLLLYVPFRYEQELVSADNSRAGGDGQYEEECYLRGVMRRTDTEFDYLGRVLRDCKNPLIVKQVKRVAAMSVNAGADADGADDESLTDLKRLLCSMEKHLPGDSWGGGVSGIPFSECTPSQQKTIFSIIEKEASGKQTLSCCIGGGGAGKTTMVKCLVQSLVAAGKKVGLTAVSASAACLLDGCTLHHFCGLGINLDTDHMRPARMRALCDADFVVVDEVSMLTDVFLAAFDKCARKARGNNLPFGGISVLLVGDPLQLPPVCKSESKPVCPVENDAPVDGGGENAGKQAKGVTPDVPDPGCSFLGTGGSMSGSPIWYNDTLESFDKYVLDGNKRTTQSDWASMLSDLRKGKWRNHFETLRKRFRSYKDAQKMVEDNGYVAVCSRVLRADEMNRASRVKDSPSEFTWTAQDLDFCRNPIEDKQALSQIEEKARFGRSVTLSVGDRVMVRKNLNPKDGVVNGMVGTVAQIYPRYRAIRITRTSDGKDIYCTPTFEIVNVTRGTFQRLQLPVCLAAASTIHKFQGQEFDKVVVCLDDLTFPGGLYTALSRCKSLDGLILTHSEYGELTKKMWRMAHKTDIRGLDLIKKFQECMNSLPTPDPGYDPVAALSKGMLDSMALKIGKDKVGEAQTETPDWCVCGNCVYEASSTRQICCGKPSPACTSVLKLAEIAMSLCLDDGDLYEEGPSLWDPSFPIPDSVEELTLSQRIFVSHRRVFRALHGKGQWHVQVGLPSCCRKLGVQYARAEDLRIRSRLDVNPVYDAWVASAVSSVASHLEKEMPHLASCSPSPASSLCLSSSCSSSASPAPVAAIAGPGRSSLKKDADGGPDTSSASGKTPGRSSLKEIVDGGTGLSSASVNTPLTFSSSASSALSSSSVSLSSSSHSSSSSSPSDCKKCALCRKKVNEALQPYVDVAYVFELERRNDEAAAARIKQYEKTQKRFLGLLRENCPTYCLDDVGTIKCLEPNGEPSIPLAFVSADDGICGPIWGAFGFRNSCAIDTVWMCMLAWYINFGKFTHGDRILPHLKHALDGVSCALAYLSGSAPTGLRLQMSKMIFWHFMSIQTGGVRFDFGGDNFMSLQCVMMPLMEAFGSFTTELSGNCSACGHPLAKVCTHKRLELSGADAACNGDVYPASTLSALVSRAFLEHAPQCTACRRHEPSAATVSAVFSPHVLVDCMFQPAVHISSGRRLCCPTIDCALDLPLRNSGSRDHYLDRLMFHVNGNHYNAILWICESAGVRQGWYFYDGMENMPDDWVIPVNNCTFLGDESLGTFEADIDRLAGLTYSRYTDVSTRPKLRESSFVSLRVNRRIADRRQSEMRRQLKPVCNTGRTRNKCCSFCGCDRCDFARSLLCNVVEDEE
jgi:hypothetical protein